MKPSPIEILLVEDDVTDSRIVCEALLENEKRIRVHAVSDGQDAVDFLKKQGKFGSVQSPHLVILDFNLPKKHGREVLQEVKSDEKIRQIPIVVLSTSSSEKDIRTAYDLHANSYLIKPWELEEFRALVHHLRDYWIHFAEITVTGQGV